VTKDNAESLITFFLGYAGMLEGFSYGSIERVENIQVLRPEYLREKAWKLKFRYLLNEGGDRSITTENELRVDMKTSTTDFTVKAVAFQNVGNIHEWFERIASTYRKLALEWTTEIASSYVNSPSSHQPSERELRSIDRTTHRTVSLIDGVQMVPPIADIITLQRGRRAPKRSILP